MYRPRPFREGWLCENQRVPFSVDTDGNFPVPVDIENVTCVTLSNFQQIFKVPTSHFSHHSLGCFTWIHCSLMRLVMLYTPKRFQMLLPNFEKASPSIDVKKTLQQSFISGHKSQVSQTWVPCQTTFARSNQRIVSSWMWSQEPSRKEEVSKKSCGKRKPWFSNLEMLYLLSVSSEYICVHLPGPCVFCTWHIRIWCVVQHAF